MKRDIKGVGVALVTPFTKGGEVDFDALGRVVDHVTAGGVDYLVVLGTTAETPTLTPQEKQETVAYIKDRNAGRLPIIVGCGGYSTEEVVRSLSGIDFGDVDAVLSVTPYYNKPTQEGLYRHFERVAEASPVPVLLYNVPSRTGVNMLASTTLRIAHNVKNVLGIKEACGTMTQMAELLCGRPEGFKVISGDDILALPLAAMGGDGVISVAGNAFPDSLSKMMRAAEEGHSDDAAAIFARLYPAFDALFREGNPAGVKAALAVKGLIDNGVRLPLVASSKELYSDIEEIIGRNRL